MRKTIITIAGTVLIIASTVQMATAAEHHHLRKAAAHRPAAAAQQFRDANGYMVPQVRSGGYSGYDGASGSGMAGH